MKKISYRIFKGEKSKKYSFEIPQDVWDFLDQPVYSIQSTLIPVSIRKEINTLQDTYFDLHYDIIYHILAEKLGILSSDTEDLTVEDYDPDEITVHVYLDMR